MARDYAKKTTRRKRKSAPKQRARQQTRPLTWLSIGFVLGLVAASVFYFKRADIAKSSSQIVQKTMQAIQPQQTKQKPKPRFDFYTVLTQPSKASVAQQPPTTETQPTEKRVEKKATYIIQVASFKNYADADQLKAQLALKGFLATIQATQNQKTRWYRVYLGPYASQPLAQQAQHALKQQQMNGMIRRVT